MNEPPPPLVELVVDDVLLAVDDVVLLLVVRLLVVVLVVLLLVDLLSDVPLDVVEAAEPVLLDPVVGAGELDVGGCAPGTVAAVPAIALVQAVRVTADNRTANARRYRTTDVAAVLTQARPPSGTGARWPSCCRPSP